MLPCRRPHHQRYSVIAPVVRSPAEEQGLLQRSKSIGLQPTGTRNWRIKPKLHLFLHLCSDGGRPSLFWTYRDEDYGGTVARYSRRRGGLLSARGMSEGMLDRFRMEPMICMTQCCSVQLRETVANARPFLNYLVACQKLHGWL